MAKTDGLMVLMMAFQRYWLFVVLRSGWEAVDTEQLE